MADCKVAAYLLIPGWVNSLIQLKTTRRHAQQDGKEFKEAEVRFHEKKPADGAWMPDQVVDELTNALKNGESFYIICPDNETSNDKFKLRIQWAADD
jgi:hypothetical protein